MHTTPCSGKTSTVLIIILGVVLGVGGCITFVGYKLWDVASEMMDVMPAIQGQSWSSGKVSHLYAMDGSQDNQPGFLVAVAFPEARRPSGVTNNTKVEDEIFAVTSGFEFDGLEIKIRREIPRGGKDVSRMKEWRVVDGPSFDPAGGRLVLLDARKTPPTFTQIPADLTLLTPRIGENLGTGPLLDTFADMVEKYPSLGEFIALEKQ